MFCEPIAVKSLSQKFFTFSNSDYHNKDESHEDDAFKNHHQRDSQSSYAFEEKIIYKEEKNQAFLASQAFIKKSQTTRSSNSYNQKRPVSPISIRNDSVIYKMEDSFEITKTKNIEDNVQMPKKHNIWNDLSVLKRIGTGAYGEVFLVFSSSDKRCYALKQLLKNPHNKFNNISAEREYKALKLLVETNNSKLLQVQRLHYTPNEDFAVLMEMGDGTLEDFIIFLKKMGYVWEDEDYLNLYFLLRCQQDLLEKIKLCHRDIKPANIIFSSDGSLKFVDYGFAKILEIEGKQRIDIVGTRNFWAQEFEKALVAGQKECYVDPFEADLYSIKQTVNHIMSQAGRSDNIDQLLKKNPNFSFSNKLKIYELHKDEYKAASFSLHFAEVKYQLSSLKAKIKNILVDYKDCLPTKQILGVSTGQFEKVKVIDTLDLDFDLKRWLHNPNIIIPSVFSQAIIYSNLFNLLISLDKYNPPTQISIHISENRSETKPKASKKARQLIDFTECVEIESNRSKYRYHYSRTDQNLEEQKDQDSFLQVAKNPTKSKGGRENGDRIKSVLEFVNRSLKGSLTKVQEPKAESKKPIRLKQPIEEWRNYLDPGNTNQSKMCQVIEQLQTKTWICNRSRCDDYILNLSGRDAELLREILKESPFKTLDGIIGYAKNPTQRIGCKIWVEAALRLIPLSSEDNLLCDDSINAYQPFFRWIFEESPMLISNKVNLLGSITRNKIHKQLTECIVASDIRAEEKAGLGRDENFRQIHKINPQDMLDETRTKENQINLGGFNTFTAETSIIEGIIPIPFYPIESSKKFDPDSLKRKGLNLDSYDTSYNTTLLKKPKVDKKIKEIIVSEEVDYNKTNEGLKNPYENVPLACFQKCYVDKYIGGSNSKKIVKAKRKNR